jgi:serine/threonine-protein kinase
MLTGVLPFRGDSMAELMYRIANEPAPDPRAIRKELPERLAQVVARALVKKPEQRFQDGDDFARELRAVLAQGPGRPAPAAAAPVQAVPAGDADDNRTVAFRASGAADPKAAPVMGAHNAFLHGTQSAGQPGYDAAQRDDGLPGQAGQEPSREL